jgi:hypothetical protein
MVRSGERLRPCPSVPIHASQDREGKNSYREQQPRVDLKLNDGEECDTRRKEAESEKP